jgi:rhodanese-related sulfurtransferase
MKKLFAFAVLSTVFFTHSACSQSPENSSVNEQKPTIAKDIDVKEFALKAKSGEYFLLDVRTPEEYAEAHLSGATLMNIYDVEFENQLSTLDKNVPVLVYCRSGGRSGKAMQMMREKGFSEVYNLEGGITTWIQEGEKVEK